MKNLSKVFFVIIFFSLVFTLNSGLYAFETCKEGTLKCAVCGTAIQKDAAKIKTEYNGKTYYFASEKCKVEFEKNPEKYAKGCTHKAVYVCPEKGCKYKSDKPGKCPTCNTELKKIECNHEHEGSYVCPMKQCNYKTDKPGECPKCGMKLKKATTCPHHKHEYKHSHKDDHKH